MKKLIALLAATALTTVAAFALEGLKFDGEVKTGIFWQELQDAGQPKINDVKLHSKDDAGPSQGRFRLNMEYDNGNGFGIKVRFQSQELSNDFPNWSYAFGYGNFFDEQMTVSIGKLGASPWGTGGPEKWKELENASGGGMRIEWKPNFIPPQYGKINAGFVLNWFNSPNEAGKPDNLPPTLLDLLMESVIGVSYTHEYFMVRFAWRLDSDYDRELRADESISAGEGQDVVYRIEEHVLKNYLPGMEVWALGVLRGVFAQDKETVVLENWLFAQYSPDMFTAQIRFGYDVIQTRKRFHVKPSFYWHFFDHLLSAGASFAFAQDFGDKLIAGSSYEYIEVEPKIQLNFSSSYIAFVYNLRREQWPGAVASARGDKPIRQTQWMNLRFCIYY
jgi:hypothetical protein